MNALTLEDLLPLEEFAGRRRELFDAHGRYLDRYRRVRIGPRLTLLFENRQTLWFRVQDILRIARLIEPRRVQHELDVFNRLLPGPDRLQGAMIIAISDESRLSEELAPWQDLRGHELCLHLGPTAYPANLLTCRPEDRAIGTAHWVQFVVDPQARALLADTQQPAYFGVSLPGYLHKSDPLSEDVRESLLADLGQSRSDGAAA